MRNTGKTNLHPSMIGQVTIQKYPDMAVVIKQTSNIVRGKVSLAGCTPVQVGEINTCRKVMENIKQDRLHFCKFLKGKHSFTVLYGTSTFALNELKGVLKASVQRKHKGESSSHSRNGTN
jgi:hypothetical protein